MNQDSNLLADRSNSNRSFEKATPFPTASAHYRSRIYSSKVNINPLIASCDQILSLVTILNSSEYPEDRNKLLQDLAHEIRSFEHSAQIANYQANIIVAARFALCCLIDETIKSTTWGQNNNWSEDNLLAMFHNENSGDDRFFTIIDHALENTSTNLHLIELLYICLNLGFTGRYKYSTNEQSELIAITNRLYQIVGQHSHHNLKNILIQDKKSNLEQNSIKPHKPKIKIKIKTAKLIWITATFAFISSCIIYFGLSFKLSNAAKPIHSIVEQVIKNKSGI